jgi:hypothetical protein
MDQVVRLASGALADWVGEGIDYCMNQYNGNCLRQGE